MTPYRVFHWHKNKFNFVKNVCFALFLCAIHDSIQIKPSPQTERQYFHTRARQNFESELRGATSDTRLNEQAVLQLFDEDVSVTTWTSTFQIRESHLTNDGPRSKTSELFFINTSTELSRIQMNNSTNLDIKTRLVVDYLARPVQLMINIARL